MNKLMIPVLVVFLLLAGLTFAASPIVVTSTYTKTVTIDATTYTTKSCNVQSNYESGNCQYLFACYVIVPKGSTDLSQATQKECIDITDTKKGTLNIIFSPVRGQRWGLVTFLAVQQNAYNYQTYNWQTNVTLPLEYRSGEELVSLCTNGKILRDVLCYDYKPVCIDQFKTNMCNNPYSLYVLDYGYGFQYNNIASYCADRNDDMICDKTEGLTCSDSNANGVCDSDDALIQGSYCADANHNWVCDSVESQGLFCRTNYDPVHCGTGTSCVTYPNSCFAKGAQCTSYINGTCLPIYTNLCYSDSECPAPCPGVTGICKNPDNTGNRCVYAGECNPRVIQCSVSADCPKSPCVGVDLSCVSNKCNAVGKCITQPQQLSLWQQIANFFSGLVAWMTGLFGW